MRLNLILFGTQLCVCGTFPHNDMLAAGFPIVQFPSQNDEKKPQLHHFDLKNPEQKNAFRKRIIVGENVSRVQRVEARFNLEKVISLTYRNHMNLMWSTSTPPHLSETILGGFPPSSRFPRGGYMRESTLLPRFG